MSTREHFEALICLGQHKDAFESMTIIAEGELKKSFTSECLVRDSHAAFKCDQQSDHLAIGQAIRIGYAIAKMEQRENS